MNREKILVALSGGIDSAATVLMLREEGFEVEGLYIDMLGSAEARNQASNVARRLAIKLHVENITEEFNRKIITHTLNEHTSGRTPSPCAICNPLIKWEVTQRVADRLGIWKFATGHYVRVIDSAVYKGVDPAKDQSYYLWGVAPKTLSRAITPLGSLTKREVRDYLHAHDGFVDLALAGESMSICFIGRTPYNEFLARNLDVKAGETVDQSGNVVGTHGGYQLYTIGQKRGFTGGGAVIAVDVERNRIVTSAEPRILYTDTILLRDWVIHHHARRLHIKVRGIGRNPQSEVVGLEQPDDGTLRITLAEPDAWAVAQGQPVVLYAGDRVIGGGIAIVP